MNPNIEQPTQLQIIKAHSLKGLPITSWQAIQSKIEINFVGSVPIMTVTHKGRFLCRSALRRYCKTALAKPPVDHAFAKKPFKERYKTWQSRINKSLTKSAIKNFKGTIYERELFDESVVVINWEKVA